MFLLWFVIILYCLQHKRNEIISINQIFVHKDTKMEPIVHKLKRLLRDKNISHAEIAEKLGKHRTFITRKIGGDSMETRLLEDILEATELTYQHLVCNEDNNLREELDEIKKEISMLKEYIPQYNKKQSE